LKPSEVTEPGFYWIVGPKQETPRVAELDSDSDWRVVTDSLVLHIMSPSELDEEGIRVLAGPIPPPQWAR
jgi:hypothetical protein